MVRLRERFPVIRKLIGKELLAKLTPQINIFKSMLTLKVLIVYGINSNLICMQVLRNTYRTNAVPHVICRLPWISSKIRKLLRSRDRLYRKSKQARKNNKESIENKLRSLKHKIRREARAAYWNYVETNILPETSDDQIEVIKNWGPSSNTEKLTQSALPH